MGRDPKGTTGQATTETILLTWILLLLFLASYQLFLVHDQVYRAMATVEWKLFQAGFEHNCHDNSDKCKYNLDQNAMVIWREQDIPEVKVPILSMWQRFGLERDTYIHSNAPDRISAGGQGCTSFPCKRTKMGAGTYYPILSVYWGL